MGQIRTPGLTAAAICFMHAGYLLSVCLSACLSRAPVVAQTQGSILDVPA